VAATPAPPPVVAARPGGIRNPPVRGGQPVAAPPAKQPEATTPAPAAPPQPAPASTSTDPFGGGSAPRRSIHSKTPYGDQPAPADKKADDGAFIRGRRP